MKIVVYEPHPEAEPVLRLKLRKTVDCADYVALISVDANGHEQDVLLFITDQGISLTKPYSCKLPKDDSGRIKVCSQK